jgi:hypothetical protein
MKFEDLVDRNGLLALYKNFTGITRAVTAITNLEGDILTATGWKDISTQFHFKHPVVRQQYRKDVITAGKHTVNFFTGQFFFEPTENDYFVHQAQTYGFDKESEANNKVSEYE